jgi:hypothetical protein
LYLHLQYQMKKGFAFLYFWWLTFAIVAQPADWQLLKSIPIKASLFTTDKFGNVYIAKPNNSIVKYNQNGDSCCVYNALSRGTITQIDATNPLNILVYYNAMMQINVLNNLLVLKQSIDLKKNNIYNCAAISSSADGDIWIFNSLYNQLQKINAEQKISDKSINFTQLFNTEIAPVLLTEQERNLFVVDTTQGIMRFDQFGTYITTYHFNTTNIQFINNQIVYYKYGTLFNYNLNSLNEKKFSISNPENVIGVRIEKNRVFVLRFNTLEIFTL